MNPSNNGNRIVPHIFVGVASHDHRVHTRFMMSIMTLVGCNKFKLTLSNVSGGGIHKARNNLAWEFLARTDAPYYLSLDTDIQFDPQHVERLLFDMETHHLGIVGAPYCHKKPELEWSARAIEGKCIDPDTGLQEMNAIGTGFILIHRKVFEKIRADHPEIAHIEDWTEGKSETKWDFFSEGIVQDAVYYPEPTFLSEDFYFCKRARDAGFPVFLDTSFFVKHWEGSRGYPEKMPTLMSAQEIRNAAEKNITPFKRE